MKKKRNISQLLSLFMLMLFAFSITPKKVLHDVFGCHNEISTILNDSGQQQVSTKKFHCSCGQPEFQSPFIESAFTENSLVTNYKTSSPAFYKSAIYCNSVMHYELRGPPVIA